MPPSPTTPLCEPDYLLPPVQLPPSRAPFWMRLGLAVTLVLLLVVAAGTLLGPMDETVAMAGIVQPVEQRVVYSGVEAELAEILVRPGDEVAAGAVLMRLEPRDFDNRLALLGAKLAEARAALRLAEVSRERIESGPWSLGSMPNATEQTGTRVNTSKHSDGSERMPLIDGQAAREPRETFNRLFAGGDGEAARREAAERVAWAESVVAGLEVQRAVVEAERKLCEVVAPVAGRVLALTSRLPGERMTKDMPLVRLASGEARQLVLSATEDRLDLIKPGQRVRFQLKRQSDKLARMAQAVVSQVALDRSLADEPEAMPRKATAGGKVEAYRITARVVRAEPSLPLGAEVEAEIILRHESFGRHLWRRLRR